MRTTYFGIHRAEYQFFYKDSLSKKFSSQGEKRMFTLIMKLASEKILSEYRRKSPILLIDDAMLETSKQFSVGTFIVQLCVKDISENSVIFHSRVSV